MIIPSLFLLDHKQIQILPSDNKRILWFGILLFRIFACSITSQIFCTNTVLQKPWVANAGFA